MTKDPRIPDEPAAPVTTPAVTPHWHALKIGQIMQMLDTSDHGLSDQEAESRTARYGANQLPSTPPVHPLKRFLAQFNNALIYFLLAAAVGAWILGHYVDAAVILAVVTVNAIVGFIQEGKAEKALSAIRAMISPRAHVLRNGARGVIPVEQLVPGDIVVLEAGDRVPADLRLLRARAMVIDESLLTGESVAAQKQDHLVAREAPLAERTSMAYSGTLVATGHGTGIVIGTGRNTEIGHISTMVDQAQSLSTPLLRQINSFGRRFTWIAISAAVLLFFFAVLVRGYAWTDALIAVVALAVGVVPEGLPAVITITLAIGVQRMAQRNAVIRRLPAVETLGATSVICTDKTGTLTRNEMTVRHLIGADFETGVGGSGYEPHGELGPVDVASQAALLDLIRAGLLCNDAQLRQVDGHWRVAGDPMEGALIALALKAGMRTEDEHQAWARLDDIPFDARHRFMATLHRNASGQTLVFVKGAPEQLLGMCALQRGRHGDTALTPQYWHDAIARRAQEGERVLGFACKMLAPDQEQLAFEDLEHGLIFLGVAGFLDPPRAEAMAAVAQCRSAGIAIKMITGDHADTAAAIARQLGIADDPKVMTGADVDRVSDEELYVLAKQVSVFARTSPEHKLRIVQVLQSDGAVVAMTGDGVNDAPSLKQADVGIAMGRKGTEAAKEVAEVVLLDDNFSSIVATVHEGRTVYDNIRKVISWTIPTNGGEALTVIIALLAGFSLPLTPAQILWINLILTVTLGLALAFEPPEPGIMERRPRAANAPLLSPFLVWRIVFVSLLFVAGALGVFFGAQARGHDLDTARTMVVNVIVVLEIFYLFNVRYLHGSSITLKGIVGTPAVLAAVIAVVIAQLVFNHAPFMHDWFASRPIPLVDGLMILACGVLLLLILEAEKIILRRLNLLQE